jgi:hypothetical protein
VTGTRLGYRVVLPPAWTKIPLIEGAEQKVDEILDNTFRDLPTDKYGPRRAELRKRLLAQIETARAANGIDLYLPVDRMHGKTIGASFLIGVLATEIGQSAAAEDVLVALAGQLEDARMAEVGEGPAIRTEKTVPAVAGAQDESSFGSRRVDYVVAIPGESERFLTIAFSTLGDGDPEGQVADVLVTLFDAVVSTFTWVREPVAESADGG